MHRLLASGAEWPGTPASTVKAGHLSLITRPNAVANIIQTAADSIS